MSNLYRDPFIDAPYQVSVGLSKRCQRRRFLKINNIGMEITAFIFSSAKRKITLD
jgi:hypothetical protein